MVGSPNSYLAEQVASLQQQVTDLRTSRVVYVQAPVVSVDAAHNTFGATIPNPVDGSSVTLTGITSPTHFLPAVGQTVTLALSGPHILYQPQGIASGAVGTVQIASQAVGTAQLAPGSVSSTILGTDVSGQIVTAESTAATALSTANGKNTVTYSTNTPSGSGIAAGDMWFQTHTGVIVGTWQWDGTTWQSHTFGDQVLNTLTAGKITTGTLGAGVSITAGSPTGDHSTIDSTGIHIFQAAPDGTVTEIGRLGTAANDFLGIGDSAGNLVAAIDESGVGNFTGLVSSRQPTFAGVSLPEMLSPFPQGVIAHFAEDGTLDILNVTTEVQIVATTFTAVAGRHYRFTGQGMRWSNATNGIADGAVWLIRLFPTPSGWSANELVRTEIQGGVGFNAGHVLEYDIATLPAGDYQAVLSVAAAGNAIEVKSFGGEQPHQIVVEDLGASVPATGQFWTTSSAGTTTPPAAPKNLYTGDIAPAGYWTYRGVGGTLANNSLRTDTTDVVQGLDPSGFNGDGHGGWNFTIPNITGTVTRVDLYVYNNWAYFSSGGQALIRLVSSANTATPTVLKTVWNPNVAYPKPGDVTVTLPSSWNSTFAGKTSIGVYLGPASLVKASDETYYIRADGAKARLRIWYTQ